MTAKTVLVLGGRCVGGLVGTDHLRRLLPSEHRVVLVEKNMQHAFAPSFLWVMRGDRNRDTSFGTLPNSISKFAGRTVPS